MNWLVLPTNGSPIPKNFHEKVRESLATVEEPAEVVKGCAKLEAAIKGFKKMGMDTKELGKSLGWAELRLGELLGPPPGKGGRKPKNLPHAVDLPDNRTYEFRRMAANKAVRNVVSQSIRKGQWSRRARLKAVDAYYASRNKPKDDLDIRNGDFQDVLSDIKPDSVDLILTDPPYADVDAYENLGRFANLVLKTGGSLVAYSGQHNLPEVLDVLRDSGLRYWWTLALLHSSGSQSLQGKKLTCGWKPLVWFVKGSRSKDAGYIRDTIAGSKPDKQAFAQMDKAEKRNAEWAQGEQEVIPIIRDMTSEGDLIVDPFAGSGTFGRAATRLKRRFVGAEIGK